MAQCRAALRVVAVGIAAVVWCGCALDVFDSEPVAVEGQFSLEQLWREPADLPQRDLFHGIGGAALVPDPRDEFRHLSTKKDPWASSPGYHVRDSRGIKWSVKLGVEARPEVLVSRLLWAVGYHQPPTYYVPEWVMKKDGKRIRHGEARFRPLSKRLKPLSHRIEKVGTWSWTDNPFRDTRPFRGLLVLMVLVNNWDLTTQNTAVYDLGRRWNGARRWYTVKDLGAAISRNRGALLQGTRGDIEGFAKQGFIAGVYDGQVRFDWGGPHAELLEGITPEDVRWVCALLDRLSDRQWEDALRAAGYGGDEALRLRRTLEQRIAAGRNLT